MTFLFLSNDTTRRLPADRWLLSRQHRRSFAATSPSWPSTFCKEPGILRNGSPLGGRRGSDNSPSQPTHGAGMGLLVAHQRPPCESRRGRQQLAHLLTVLHGPGPRTAPEVGTPQLLNVLPAGKEEKFPLLGGGGREGCFCSNLGRLYIRGHFS